MKLLKKSLEMDYEIEFSQGVPSSRFTNYL